MNDSLAATRESSSDRIVLNREGSGAVGGTAFCSLLCRCLSATVNTLDRSVGRFFDLCWYLTAQSHTPILVLARLVLAYATCMSALDGSTASHDFML